jgi:putative phosphoesterase
MHRIGLIADTHGRLRPEALDALAGCEAIVHAGDIGSPDVLAALATLAPVTAVRGNNDDGDWADALPESTLLRIDDVMIQVLHDRADLKRLPLAPGVRVLVTGHSHQPLIEEREGVLYVNPGSAGPRRFRLPVTVAELRIEGASVEARLLPLL